MLSFRTSKIHREDWDKKTGNVVNLSVIIPGLTPALYSWLVEVIKCAQIASLSGV